MGGIKMAWQKFNLNDKIRVKLTEKGRRLHRAQWEARAIEYQWQHEYPAPKEDAEGWSEWQAWVFMQDMGHAMQSGFDLVCESTIEVKIK